MGVIWAADAVWRSSTKGDHTSLAALLRSSEPLSAETRGYLADLIECKIKRKRGRKRSRSYGDPVMRSVVRAHVDAVMNILKVGEDEAIHRITESGRGLTADQIDHILYPRKKAMRSRPTR